MATQYTDIGANLAHDSFDADRDQVLQRAAAAGVSRIVVTGSCVSSSRMALTLAQQHPGQLWATAGLHPHHASDFSEEALQAFRDCAQQPEVVAIGETGLDFFRDFSPREAQEHAFVRHLELAAEMRMPLFLHQRDAHERFLPILREHRASIDKVVVHCFTGSSDELDDYLDLDCHIGLTGWICDERRGHHMHDYIGRIPDNRLMIESDAPYLMPRNLDPKPKTRRNEPCWLPAVAATLAAIRHASDSQVARVTTETARNFFSLGGS